MTDQDKTQAAPEGTDATDSPTGTTTGADQMAAASNDDGAVKGYLGADAADLQAKPELAEAAGVQVPAEVRPTTFQGAQPPGGHVADPTSEGHVGSTGDTAKGESSDPRPESAKGTTGTTAENADQAAPGTLGGITTPVQGQQAGSTTPAQGDTSTGTQQASSGDASRQQ